MQVAKVLLLAVAAWSCLGLLALAKPIVTCGMQSECLDFTIDCNPASGPDDYKICMKLNLDKPGCKKDGCTISHMCSGGSFIPSEATCSTTDVNELQCGSGLCPDGSESTCKLEEPVSGTTLCKVVGKGEIADFAVKDGNLKAIKTMSLTPLTVCTAGAATPVTFDNLVTEGAGINAVSATCDNPVEGQPPCGCNGYKAGSQPNECLWKIQAPAGACSNTGPVNTCTGQSETAYAYIPVAGSTAVDASKSTCLNTITGLNAQRWGWTFKLSDALASQPLKIVASAGQCDVSKGRQVGTVTLSGTPGSALTVTVALNTNWKMSALHIWYGATVLPLKNGAYSAANGDFTIKPTFNPAITGTTSYTLSPSTACSGTGCNVVIHLAVACDSP